MATSASTLDNNLSTGGTNSQNLANWAAPYVTDMLGKAKALSAEPYQTYTGPLTAGESSLQTNAFSGLAGLTVPKGFNEATTTAGNIATDLSGLSYNPTQFTNQYSAPVSSAFDQSQAKNYMNPFVEAALAPQMEAARRQALLAQLANNSKATQAGAFGGNRAALVNLETQRNLDSNLSNILGQGYSTAYDKAVAQFNAEQNRKVQEAQNQAQYGMDALRAGEQSNQFGANYDVSAKQAALNAAQVQSSLAGLENKTALDNINAQLSGGAVQRGIDSEGILADRTEFEKQRMNPYDQLKFQQAMLAGLPMSSVTNTPGDMTDLGALLAGIGGAGSIAGAAGYKNVGDLVKDLYKGYKDLGGTTDTLKELPDWWESAFGSGS